jgi:hypothetical protein
MAARSALFVTPFAAPPAVSFAPVRGAIRGQDRKPLAASFAAPLEAIFAAPPIASPESDAGSGGDAAFWRLVPGG